MPIITEKIVEEKRVLGEKILEIRFKGGEVTKFKSSEGVEFMGHFVVVKENKPGKGRSQPKLITHFYHEDTIEEITLSATSKVEKIVRESKANIVDPKQAEKEFLDRVRENGGLEDDTPIPIPGGITPIPRAR